MDRNTEEAAVETLIEAQRNEIRELVLSFHHDDSPTDNKGDRLIAAHLNLAELKSYLTSLRDRRMAESIASAVGTDHQVIAEVVRQEVAAHQDRQFAQFLDSIPDGEDLYQQHNPAQGTVYNGLDEDTISRLARFNMSADITRPPQANNRQVQRQTCIACAEHKPIFLTVEVECGHNYCQGCIRDLFRASVIDEQLFPPRCCRVPIVMHNVSWLFDQKFKDSFALKEQEFSTTNRVYCSNATCSRFLPNCPAETDIATCPDCGSQTCTTCKGVAHEGECPKDAGLESVIELAGQEGWQQCPNCHRMIELGEGCYHMTCVCSFQFCYLCAVQWKQCECRQWDEERLLQRADAIARRNPTANDAEHAREVQQAVEMLHQRHECEHVRFRSIHRANTCEECHKRMPEFIYECRNCRVMMCRRCRNNRLR